MATLPRHVHVTVRCTACGATADAKLRVTETASTRTSCTLHVQADRDDQAWLVLFDQAHQGPLEHVR